VWRLDLMGNRLILWAIVTEVLLLVALLGWQPLTQLLGGTWPGAAGWSYAAMTALAVVVADGATKTISSRRRGSP
jgi:hypothetical protein